MLLTSIHFSVELLGRIWYPFPKTQQILLFQRESKIEKNYTNPGVSREIISTNYLLYFDEKSPYLHFNGNNFEFLYLRKNLWTPVLQEMYPSVLDKTCFKSSLQKYKEETLWKRVSTRATELRSLIFEEKCPWVIILYYLFI